MLAAIKGSDSLKLLNDGTRILNGDHAERPDRLLAGSRYLDRRSYPLHPRLESL